ncbi:hypothetical protein EYF80_038820 [Liparis tanakae]|uniref:Uncharacterized protein n=1 Tax=Liparis tanakae TaxID=230148 RepID=A0A4Z2GBF3_9TELE|nr:hypothetical protein EYF80_038820 [Liparis tanakae]
MTSLTGPPVGSTLRGVSGDEDSLRGFKSLAKPINVLKGNEKLRLSRGRREEDVGVDDKAGDQRISCSAQGGGVLLSRGPSREPEQELKVSGDGRRCEDNRNNYKQNQTEPGPSDTQSAKPSHWGKWCR